MLSSLLVLCGLAVSGLAGSSIASPATFETTRACLLALQLAGVSWASRGQRSPDDSLSLPGPSRTVYDAPLLSCSSETQYLPPKVYRLQSPNYRRYNPRDYPQDFNCTYGFRPFNLDGMLRFDCWFFQLEDSDWCVKDSFQVRQNGGYCKYCGDTVPASFLADNIYIHFVSDSSVTNKGYFCTVASKVSGAGLESLPCGPHTLTPGTYTLQSQNFPSDYDTNLYCKWDLKAADPSSTIKFSCGSFDMVSWDGTCQWDWMKVDGKLHCNNYLPETSWHTGALVVEYSTPDLPAKVRNGFNCTVTVTTRGD